MEAPCRCTEYSVCDRSRKSWTSQCFPLPLRQVDLHEGSTTDFFVTFPAPKDTPYEGGLYKVHVELPDQSAARASRNIHLGCFRAMVSVAPCLGCFSGVLGGVLIEVGFSLLGRIWATSPGAPP